jgi:hypothetical protein
MNQRTEATQKAIATVISYQSQQAEESAYLWYLEV